MPETPSKPPSAGAHSAPCLGSAVPGSASQTDLGQPPDDDAPPPNVRATPAGIASLMGELLGIHEGMTVYDPACGTGGLLMAAVDRLRRSGGDARSLELYGQASDQRVADAALRALRSENLENIDIKVGDVLRDPQHLSSPTHLARFDVVLANPPFSCRSWGQPDRHRGDRFGRDVYGRPPASNGDFAYVLHVVASLRERGRAVMVLPPGVLYRGGAEGRIREALIRHDLVDAIIGLPSKLFAGTTTPVVLLLLERGRPASRRGQVLFVDGTSAPPDQTNQHILSDEQSARLVDAVRRYADDDGHVRVVPIDEIAANGFDLSLARYLRPSVAPAMRLHRRSSRSREVANPALAEARAALEQAQLHKARRANELFTGGDSGVGSQTTRTGALPAHWRLLELRDCLEVSPRNGPFFHDQPGDHAVVQVGQTAMVTNGLVDLLAAKQREVREAPREVDRLRPGDVLLKRVHANANEVATAALVPAIPETPLFCESQHDPPPSPRRSALSGDPPRVAPPCAGPVHHRHSDAQIRPGEHQSRWHHVPALPVHSRPRGAHGDRRSAGHAHTCHPRGPRPPGAHRGFGARRRALRAPSCARSPCQRVLPNSRSRFTSTSSIRAATLEPASQSRTSAMSMEVWMC